MGNYIINEDYQLIKPTVGMESVNNSTLPLMYLIIATIKPPGS